jgi:hypothetical protein
VIGFKGGISTFTCDQPGDEYERINYILFYPLLGVSFSSRDVLKLWFKNLVIA